MERDMHAKAIRKSKTEQLANKQKQTLVHATAIKKADKQIKQRRTKKTSQRIDCNVKHRSQPAWTPRTGSSLSGSGWCDPEDPDGCLCGLWADLSVLLDWVCRYVSPRDFITLDDLRGGDILLEGLMVELFLVGKS